jgi:hypothetical protein
MDAANLLVNVKNDSCFPTLTFKERITGFIICEAMGIATSTHIIFKGLFIQLFSFGSIIGIIAGTPYKFAMTYTLGHIISMSG